MANNNTVFEKLNNLFTNRTGGVPQAMIPSTHPAATALPDSVIFSTSNKQEYEKKMAQYQQQKLLSYQWIKAGADNAMESLAGYTATKLMYRDADLMDGSPEIGTALDIISQESCPINSKGQMINISSKSTRVKSVLEDLFVNRLNVHIELPGIARKMAKYGNVFRLLNISGKDGIMGWRDMPVYEIDRIENGYTNGNYGAGIVANAEELKPDEVRFVWTGHNESLPYRDWQVAHFRLLNDTFFLPYGTSCLHKARRAWRMWSMMEDAMLIYRLDKSIERRVYKIYVGAIDDADVPAYVQQVADNFKRTQIIDPATGQVDLRKNFLDVSSDYFIPVRSENAPNPIESLGSATWNNQMEDIEYMQNKILTALQIPKSYLNFQEAQGKGENLAVKDIRFARMINRVQQYLIAELNKVAMIHLYLIGMTDDVSNFSITLNNPTNQIESQELDDLTKRVGVATQVLADPGIGMPLFSLHKTLKEVMKMSDFEIKDMLNEVRLEKAMAAELEQTATIIKKTGIFDKTDRIYGDYDAMNSPQQMQQQPAGGDAGAGGMGGGAPAGGPMPMDMGADMGGDMGDAGAPPEGATGGEEAGVDMGGAPGADAGTPPQQLSESRKRVLQENRKVAKTFTERYFEMLSENTVNDETDLDDYDTKNEEMNENVNSLLTKIENMLGDSDLNDEEN